MLTTVTDDFGMNEIIQFVNQYGVCWVLIALLVQILISVRLKNSVKHEYETKEANLKAEPQIANLRFQHTFSKQADAIVQTYRNLLPLLDATEDYTAMTSLHSQFSGEKTEKYGKGIDELKASVTPLLLELENDFQIVLGVYTAEKSP